MKMPDGPEDAAGGPSGVGLDGGPARLAGPADPRDAAELLVHVVEEIESGRPLGPRAPRLAQMALAAALAERDDRVRGRLLLLIGLLHVREEPIDLDTLHASRHHVRLGTLGERWSVSWRLAALALDLTDLVEAPRLRRVERRDEAFWSFVLAIRRGDLAPAWADLLACLGRIKAPATLDHRLAFLVASRVAGQGPDALARVPVASVRWPPRSRRRRLPPINRVRVLGTALQIDVSNVQLPVGFTAFDLPIRLPIRLPNGLPNGPPELTLEREREGALLKYRILGGASRPMRSVAPIHHGDRLLLPLDAAAERLRDRLSDVLGREAHGAIDVAMVRIAAARHVVLLGSPGVDREAIAALIHDASARRDRPFQSLTNSARPATDLRKLVGGTAFLDLDAVPRAGVEAIPGVGAHDVRWVVAARTLDICRVWFARKPTRATVAMVPLVGVGRRNVDRVTCGALGLTTMGMWALARGLAVLTGADPARVVLKRALRLLRTGKTRP